MSTTTHHTNTLLHHNTTQTHQKQTDQASQKPHGKSWGFGICGIVRARRLFVLIKGNRADVEDGSIFCLYNIFVHRQA